jgi:hypothetical protein
MERVDLLKCFTAAREAPVLLQFFLMQFGPSEHQPQLATTEGGLDRLQRVDPNLRAAVRVAGVEMGRAVIVEEHRDDDPREARDRGHEHDPVERSGQHRTTTPLCGHLGPTVSYKTWPVDRRPV